MLTDISGEMVNSVLPVYLVLHLHLGPLQYGAIDGVYNGVAVALLGLAGGLIADRRRRHKEVAAAGYGISAACKLLLLAAGGAWGWITAVVAADRLGKGVRTAPRDALISLSSERQSMAASFAVHRTLDAGGSLLGPIVAFSLLAWLPGAYDAIWVTSFVFGILGLAVLYLFVESPKRADVSNVELAPPRMVIGLLQTRRLRGLVGAGMLLSAVTISDGFLYLLITDRSDVGAGFFPLFYVITASTYMLFSIPVGRLADRWGRKLVFLFGYLIVLMNSAILLSFDTLGTGVWLLCLVLLGLHYAATEGVLMAMVSRSTPSEMRTTAIAMAITFIGLAKMASSLAFGFLWEVGSLNMAVAIFAAGVGLALPASAFWLGGSQGEEND